MPPRFPRRKKRLCRRRIDREATFARQYATTMTHRVWMVGFESLTEEQRRTAELPSDRHQLVLGPAGSGKTVLLLHRADYFLRKLRVPAYRLRVLVFTTVLKNYVRSGAESIGLPKSTVQSFYSWVFQLARERRIGFPRAGSVAQDCRNALAAVLEHFESHHLSPALDIALVDEGQDLPPEAFRLLLKAACHITVCGDYSQCLYDQSIMASEILSILGINDRPILLSIDLRSTRRIARLAACFLPEPTKGKYLLKGQSDESNLTARIPLLLRCSSIGQQWQRLSDVLRREIGRNARVGVLLPTNELVAETCLHLSKLGIPLERIVAGRSTNVQFDELTPKVLTIFSAKGLSFDSVIIPSITEANFARHSTAPENLLFVACTRALDWVCLSTVTGQEPDCLGRVSDMIEIGEVIEQDAGIDGVPITEREVVPDEDVPL